MVSLRLSRIVVAVLAALASLAAALVGAAPAAACGSGGYSYAGIAAPAHAFGVSADVTPLGAFDVPAGHVAGWVGVGGPGLGPNGSDEWLQIGFNGIPGLPGNNLYYELVRPGGQPVYKQIAGALPFGRSAHVAVLEMRGHPNYWRVWVDRKPASEPIRLPGSHGRWAPIATAEAWDGGGGACNGFLYRFGRVSIARIPGGGWQSLVGGTPITSSSTRLARTGRRGSFLAAEGPAAFRTLASFRP